MAKSVQQAIGALFLLIALAMGGWLVFSFSIERLGIAIFSFLIGGILAFRGSGSELPGLLEEKRKIEGTIAEAEKKVLQREMSEEAFRDFSFKKQKELVGIESKISSFKKKEGADSEAETQQVAARKKHVLKELLQQKKGIGAELQISEQKYLRRELGESAFFEMQRSTQSKLLEIDAEIRNLYAGENIDAVLEEMQQKLKENEPIRRKRRHQRNPSETDSEKTVSG
jgi:hypothetical protein